MSINDDRVMYRQDIIVHQKLFSIGKSMDVPLIFGVLAVF